MIPNARLMDEQRAGFLHASGDDPVTWISMF
jgi:hypothetical protein